MAPVTMNTIILCILMGSTSIPRAYGRVFRFLDLARDEDNNTGKSYTEVKFVSTTTGGRLEFDSFTSTTSTTSTTTAATKGKEIESPVPDDDKLSSNDEPWSWSAWEEEASTKSRPKFPHQITTKSAVRSTQPPLRKIFREQSPAERLAAETSESSEVDAAFFRSDIRPLEPVLARYNERRSALKGVLNDELDYNKYLVASLTFEQARALLEYLQENLAHLLSPACHLSEFPHMPNPAHVKSSQPISEDANSCGTTREIVDNQIQQLERLLASIQTYHQQTAAVKENMAEELETLHNTAYQQDMLAAPVTTHARLEPYRRFAPMTHELAEAISPPTHFSSRRSPVKRYSSGYTSGLESPKKQPDMNAHISALFPQVSRQGFSEITIAPLIAEQFEEIEAKDSQSQMSEQDRVEAIITLIEQVQTSRLNLNADIFQLASLIKNCRNPTQVVPYVKHLFPAAVRDIVWGMKNRIQITMNDTKYEVFVDSENRVQSVEVVDDNNATSLMRGEIWKFFPMNGGASFMLFNVQRNAVFMAVPGDSENDTLMEPTEAAVAMESVAGRDLTMLLKRKEFLWSLTLSCERLEDFDASTERSMPRLAQNSRDCNVIMQSRFYSNLALNLNPVGDVALLSNGKPGLFDVNLVL